MNVFVVENMNFYNLKLLTKTLNLTFHFIDVDQKHSPIKLIIPSHFIVDFEFFLIKGAHRAATHETPPG